MCRRRFNSIEIKCQVGTTGNESDAVALRCWHQILLDVLFLLRGTCGDEVTQESIGVNGVKVLQGRYMREMECERRVVRMNDGLEIKCDELSSSSTAVGRLHFPALRNQLTTRTFVT
jgi:hypothetical protein